MNGRGRAWLVPSPLTWRSSMASSSADWALGDARLSSSARRTLVKTGPGRKARRPRVAVEDDGPGDVGGQQVGGELHPAEAEAEGPGQGLGQGGLAHPGVVLDQEVALGHQAAQGEPDGDVAAQVGGADVGDHGLEGPGQVVHGDGADPVGTRQGGVEGGGGVVHATFYAQSRHLVHLRPATPTLSRDHEASLCA